MKLQFLFISLIAIAVFSCDYRKSVSKDLTTGLTTKGDGLSADDVYLSDGNTEITETTFIYGDVFYIQFEGVDGLTKENGAFFPGMSMYVVGQEGDTALQVGDLYGEHTDGFEFDPITLKCNVTVGAPINSNKTYTVYVNIWDKKGEGTLSATMDFDVVPNSHIKIESNKVSYDEIYLFSGVSNTAILDNKGHVNERIYLLFEGINGIKSVNGKANIGMRLLLTDANGQTIVDEADLAGDTEYSISDLQNQLAPHIIIEGTEFANPVALEIGIWDKNSDATINTSVELMIAKE